MRAPGVRIARPPADAKERPGGQRSGADLRRGAIAWR
jgi:hypothetical protein